MHFISAATDLTEISTTLKAAFWKHHVKYHEFPAASQRYSFNPVQTHNNALALHAKVAKFQKLEPFPVIL